MKAALLQVNVSLCFGTNDTFLFCTPHQTPFVLLVSFPLKTLYSTFDQDLYIIKSFRFDIESVRYGKLIIEQGGGMVD